MTFLVVGVVFATSGLGWLLGEDLTYRVFGFSPRFLENPLQLYRVVTSGLFHLNWGHLIGNLTLFVPFSLGVEKAHPDTYLGLLLIAGISSTLGTTLIYLLHDQEVISIGFSGVVYGVIAAFLAERPTDLFLGFIPGWLLGAAYLGMTLYDAFISAPDDHVDHFGHLGGAVGGLVYAEFVWS
ncbi:MAG: hypothetical protein KatS3mg026_0571 [Bacteroidia bacterium]|nr:MAG: hypothetical protein KatS3mg026_0571 [Bacteroidia bacterium]